jgi:TorA maturation chaperone TorD
MAKPHQPPLETLQTLAKIRRNLYGSLSSVYIQLPEKTILELRWEPAVELLRYPQKGSEEAFTQIQNGLNLVKSCGSEKGRNDEEILKNISKDWTRLFRGVVRDGILPPYESLYRPRRLPKKPAQEINRLFSEMGIQVPEEWHQPSDYIGVELDFMRLLCEREERERENMDRDALRQVLKLESSFLEEHLALWVPLFGERMFLQAHEDYYRGVSRLTTGLVGYDRTYVRIILSD